MFIALKINVGPNVLLNPLKLGFVTPFFKIVAFNFCQSIHWAFVCSNCILHIVNNNRRYFVVDWVIDMANHSHLEHI